MLDDIAKGVVEGLIAGILSRKSGSAPGHLEVHSLTLRDDQGHGRAVLAMLDGGPAVTLLGRDQRVRAVVGTGEDGPYLQFWGEDGRTNLTLRLDGASADLSFYDRAHVQRATLVLDEDGPGVQLRDSRGKCRVQVVTDENDGPSITLYDEQERPLTGLTCPE